MAQPPPQEPITPQLAIEKFTKFISKVDKGEIPSNHHDHWKYYYSRYIEPTFAESSEDVKKIIVQTLTDPKTRMTIIGDIWYLTDFLLRINELFIPIFQDSVVKMFKWCYFRILYEQLRADFLLHQQVNVDPTPLQQEQIKIDKVLNRWRKPQPTSKQLAEFKSIQTVLSEVSIRPTQDNVLVLPPVFNDVIMDELNTAQNELLEQYQTRLTKLREQFSFLNQQYDNNNNNHQNNNNNNNNTNTTQNHNTQNFNNYSNKNDYIKAQSGLDTWEYGDYDSDLLSSFADSILGGNTPNNNNNDSSHSNQSIDTNTSGPMKRIYSDMNQVPSNTQSQQKPQRVSRFPPQPSPNYTTDSYLLIQPNVWSSLITHPFTCTSCGLFFQDSTVYSDHISWHRKIKTLKMEQKEITIQAKYIRNAPKLTWYHNSEDWIYHRHTSNDIPFHLLPQHIREEKQKLIYLEELYSQKAKAVQTDHSMTSGDSLTTGNNNISTMSTRELMEKQELMILLKIIKPYDPSSQVGIVRRLQRVHARLIGKHRAAMLSNGGNNNEQQDFNSFLSDDSIFNEFDEGRNNDDDDAYDDDLTSSSSNKSRHDASNKNNRDNEESLPFYNPSSRYDNVARAILPTQPVQLLSKDDKDSTSTSSSSFSNSLQNNKREIRCVLCSDQLPIAYHEDHDTWVYTNTTVMSYKTLLTQAKSFLLNLKQFRYEKELAKQQHLDHINRGGFINRDGTDDKKGQQNKTNKVTFTKEEESKIELALQPLLKRYTTEHYANYLIHYSPCFSGILKSVLEYTNGE